MKCLRGWSRRYRGSSWKTRTIPSALLPYRERRRKARLSSPRAVPATSLSALEGLRGVVAQITGGSVRGTSSQDFDLRHRALRIRQVLAAHGLEESMFFAKVRSRDLDVLRGGARWARSVKSALDDAMAHEAAPTLRI